MMRDPGRVQSTVNESQANEMSPLLLVCLVRPYFLLNQANHSFLQEFVIKNFTQLLNLLKAS